MWNSYMFTFQRLKGRVAVLLMFGQSQCCRWRQQNQIDASKQNKMQSLYIYIYVCLYFDQKCWQDDILSFSSTKSWRKIQCICFLQERGTLCRYAWDPRYPFCCGALATCGQHPWAQHWKWLGWQMTSVSESLKTLNPKNASRTLRVLQLENPKLLGHWIVNPQPTVGSWMTPESSKSMELSMQNGGGGSKKGPAMCRVGEDPSTSQKCCVHKQVIYLIQIQTLKISYGCGFTRTLSGVSVCRFGLHMSARLINWSTYPNLVTCIGLIELWSGWILPEFVSVCMMCF